MSHHPERTEKNCLNCGTTVAGRYCQSCGQENVPSHMPFWALVQHFVFDIFHFDGKFFDTLRYLFMKPGYVAKQYVAGKRVSFLDPFRMYLFTSALFFLIFFAVTDWKTVLAEAGDDPVLGKAERFELASRVYHDSSAAPAVNPNQQLKVLLDPTVQLEKVKDTVGLEDPALRIGGSDSSIWVVARESKGLDSVTLFGNSDSWMTGQLESRWSRYKQKFDGDGQAMFNDFGDRVLHQFPYLLFVSLPFFALILKLLYRRQKQFMYSDHAIFTLYHYIFSFILLLLVFAFDELQDATGIGFFGTLAGLLIPLWAGYLFLSLRRFYGQSWGKTLAKFFVLNFVGIIGIFGLAFLFILLSVFTI